MLQLVKEVESILVPSTEEELKETLESAYFVEFLMAALTVDGLASLKELPLCQALVTQLCNVLMEDCFDSIVELLSLLDTAIVKVIE